LYKLTKKNIIDGEIQYIAGKTKDGKPRTIKVPMNKYARAIVEKYKDNPECEGDTLFPFISQQKYNDAIKDVFKAAGIIRSVVTCDPLTRENVIRPINEVASSHLARRCFVGNAYKVMKDQNLVAELSGHKQNSKAFARYREVDREMRNEVVSMIE
jgi:integrase